MSISASHLSAGRTTPQAPVPGPSRHPLGAQDPDERAQRPSLDLHVVTVDVQGRVPLARVAATAGWQAGDTLELGAGESVLRLEPQRSADPLVQATLDGRLRLQMPYRLWAGTDFQPGARLVVVVDPTEGLAVATPVATLLRHLLTGR